MNLWIPLAGLALAFLWRIVLVSILTRVLGSAQGRLADFAWDLLAPNHPTERRNLVRSWIAVYVAVLSIPALGLLTLWLTGLPAPRLVVTALVVLIAVTIQVGFEAWSHPHPTARIENARRQAILLLTNLEAELLSSGHPSAPPRSLTPVEEGLIEARRPSQVYRDHLVRLVRALPVAKAPAGWTRSAALDFLAVEIRRVDEALEPNPQLSVQGGTITNDPQR